jgi:DNA-binding response OmpR family regulator
MRHAEESITLAPAELQIMLTLVRAEGRTVRRAVLELAGWGLSDAVTPNALDVALHRLRKKLAAIDSPVQLVTARGQGYALQADDAP